MDYLKKLTSTVSKRMRRSARLIEKEITNQSINIEIKELKQLKIPFKPIKKNTTKEIEINYDSDGDVIMKCGICGNPGTRCTCKK